MIRKILRVSIWAAAVVVLCSCGKPDVRKTPGPLAVPAVGGGGSRHQVDGVNARTGSTDAKPLTAKQATAKQATAKQATAKQGAFPDAPVRERGVDQELLEQAALEVELDRDSQVAQAIERARRQILAQAFIERAMISAPPASPQEIRKFYVENPALFGQRRSYRIVELMVAMPEGQIGTLQDVAAGAKNLASVERWLESRKLSFETATRRVDAEHIPANTLRRLFEMRDGQIAVLKTSYGASVLRLEESVEAPFTEKQAAPAIARYLHNRKRIELVQAEVAKLRERAKIENNGIKRVRQATAAQNTAEKNTAEKNIAEKNTAEKNTVAQNTVAQTGGPLRPPAARPLMVRNTTDLLGLK